MTPKFDNRICHNNYVQHYNMHIENTNAMNCAVKH